MKSKLLILLVPLTLGLAVAQNSNQTAEFDKIVESHNTVNQFMGNVAIAENGKEIYSKSVGFSNLEHQAPNQPSTIFEIGSITKSFTAAAILKLQEQGKLNVTDLLSKYLPDYPGGKNITLHQLLSHTAGIPNFTDDPNFVETQKQNLSLDQVVRCDYSA